MLVLSTVIKVINSHNCSSINDVSSDSHGYSGDSGSYTDLRSESRITENVRGKG